MYYGFFDGATKKTNPGNMGFGFCIYDALKNEVLVGAGPGGFGTNNLAEYGALELLLTAAIDHGIKEITVFGDSQLVINQITGKWHAGDKLAEALNRTRQLLSYFSQIHFSWIKRDKNTRADMLSKRGLELAETQILNKKSQTPKNIEAKPENDSVAISVRTRYAVIVQGEQTYFLDLIKTKCSCGNTHGNCQHFEMVSSESNKEQS